MRFKEEVYSVLCDARAKLSEDGILAIIAIRRERLCHVCSGGTHPLKGKCEAARVADLPADAPLLSKNYRFLHLHEEEQAERRKPRPHRPLCILLPR